ncbi:DUF3311 domain-containing protein [Pseudonocardia ailaonensis]|uniref:DUF3311 domain-containing protein n=1 Tax=Pseudonocardia ailaonensis TaxID=367279 RepID=A0ABN2NP38_9PSEU
MADPSSGSGFRWSAWNLLLLIPLLMLVTPWFNTRNPVLWGMPFFYWSQFLWVPVGVVCVAIVYVRTKGGGVPLPDADPRVDDLDEGAHR